MKDPQAADYSDESSENISASQSGELELAVDAKESNGAELRTALVSSEGDAEANSKSSERAKAKRSLGSVPLHASDAAANGDASLLLCRRNGYARAAYWLLTVLSLGVLPLVDFWLEGEVYGRLVFREAADFDSATHVRVRAERATFARLTRGTLALAEGRSLETSFFRFNERLFFWSEAKRFESLFTWRAALPAAEFAAQRGGLLESEAALLSLAYGENSVRVSRALGLAGLVFSPFGAYSAVAAGLLVAAGLPVYGGLFAALAAARLALILRDRDARVGRLQRGAEVDRRVMVIRRTSPSLFQKRIIESKDLVPGDLVEVSNNWSLPADVLLTHGSAVVAEEAGLTLTKEPFPAQAAGGLGEVAARHVLCTGSKVLHTLAPLEGGCFGLVLRTGWATGRGAATRAALNQGRGDRPADATALLFCLALFAFLAAGLEAMLGNGRAAALRAAALALCPAAPVALAMAFALAKVRLRRGGVEVAREADIAAAAEAKVFLVEQAAAGGAREKASGFILSRVSEGDSPTFEKLLARRSKLSAAAGEGRAARRFLEALGLTNSLTRVGEEIFGCAREAEMLRQAPFALNSRVLPGGEVERFFACAAPGFSARYDTAPLPVEGPCKAVQVASAEGERFVALAGEPFAVQALCAKKTIPYNFSQTVSKYSTKGLRVVALAARDGPAEPDSARADFEFLGLYCAASTAPSGAFAELAAEAAASGQAVLASEGGLFAAVFAARRGGLLAPGSRVLTARTEVVNGVEALVCAELGRKAREAPEGSDASAFLDRDSFSEATFAEFDGAVAVSSPALRLILASFSEAGRLAVLRKARVFAGLAPADRAPLIQALTEAVGPVCFIFEGAAPEEALREARVAVAVGGAPTAAAICAPGGSLDPLTAVVAEARSASENRRKIAALTLVFLGLRSLALLVLAGKKTSLSAGQALLLDGAVLLGLALAQATCVGPHPPHGSDSPKIYSRRFLLALAPLLAFFAGVTLFSLALLSRAKFYDPPKALFGKGSKPRGPDSHFFFDPFVATLLVAFLILFQSFTSNLSSVLRPRQTGKVIYFAYWALLFTFLSALLLRPAGLVGMASIARALRAPMLFGFELVLAAILLASAAVIFLFRKFAPKSAHALKKKSTEAIALVDRSHNEAPSKKTVSPAASSNISVSEHKERKTRQKKKAVA